MTADALTVPATSPWGLPTGAADPRPLAVLGATAGDLRSGKAAPPRWLPAEEVVVQAGLYRDDPRLRRLLALAADRWRTDVALWDDDAGPGAPARLRHHLSIAARAFKTQAVGWPAPSRPRPG